MNIKCNLKDLINGLNIVTKSVNKTTMPILDGVLIEAFKGTIKLTTYDLDIGSEHTFNCDIISEGSTVVDIRMLNEIIRKIEDETIEIEVQDNVFILKSINGIFKLTVMNPDEYPKLPIFNVDSSVMLEQKILKDMIKRTLFSVSNDENRPIYNGALLKVEDNILTIVAIDGFRLSLRKYLSEKSINNFKAIIPGKVLAELFKILSEEENQMIKIGVNKNQALFEIGQSIIVSRIIEGEFLNYNNIIPESCETKIKIKTKSLLDSFERVALFAKENKEKDKKSPVKMNIEIDGVILSCVSENGDAKEMITAVVEGKDIEIGFNPRYVIEALKSIDDQEIYVEFTSSISPVLIKPIASNEFIYVVLPIKLKQ
ncbi:MAG: DNA polymerase III subunit beta [Clostridia bacterium]|nr:DNA polymerase III subunit beta [Clostridia bacterium]